MPREVITQTSLMRGIPWGSLKTKWIPGPQAPVDSDSWGGAQESLYLINFFFLNRPQLVKLTLEALEGWEAWLSFWEMQGKGRRDRQAETSLWRASQEGHRLGSRALSGGSGPGAAAEQLRAPVRLGVRLPYCFLVTLTFWKVLGFCLFIFCTPVPSPQLNITSPKAEFGTW